MNTRKKWATKEEAKEYIFRCLKTQNYGLSYCAACDFVGLNPKTHRERIVKSYLGFWSDCLASDEGDIKTLINNIKYDIYTAEYVENYKFKEVDNYLATNKEYLETAKAELKFLQDYKRRAKYEKRRKK